MFRRKKNEHTPSDETMAEVIRISEEQKVQSQKELAKAKKTASLLQQIREENHIVLDLREVLGGH